MNVPETSFQRPPAGFEGLLEHHLAGLYRFALSLTRNVPEAEDLLQDAVVKGLEAFRRFEAGGNFKAWIFAILMNTFRDRYRKLQRQGQKEISIESMETPPSVGAEVFDLMLKEEVLSALDELPQDFRLAVHLVDLEGMSYREAAQALECPAGTLTSRLYRGRGLLKLSLAGLAKERGFLAGESDKQGRLS
jgi:RNA polymerase sigma-70 factor (ECF subfamily)